MRAATPRSLYAYNYHPRPPLQLSPKGWLVYDFKREFGRMGVGTRTKAWRFCDVNSTYTVSYESTSFSKNLVLTLSDVDLVQFCPTYPSHLVVPTRISDATIRYASKYRSKARIPALTYLHWANLGSITRSSQPMVGLNNRSMQDEKLIEAIFTSHLFADPNSPSARSVATASAEHASGGNQSDRGNIIAIYGATTTNLIIDARPTTNAVANRAKGAGTENMEHYRGCKKAYLGVENIHVMRDSLAKVTDALRQAEAPATFGMSVVAAIEPVIEEQDDGGLATSSRLTKREATAPPLDHVALKRSQWLKHISALLEGTLIIARNVHINSSHVLIHCSDGWDRTSQLASLSELCLDPYYRTKEGFAVLIEKDWCSFGHRFWDRCGHASSEKYFTTAHGYGEDDSDDDYEGDDSRGGFEQAAANALWGFTKQLTANFQGGGDGHSSGAHLKETSPVFHQFLDCVWQIKRQFPRRFEFNDEWLLELFTQVYECRFGTFLHNSEKERIKPDDDGAPAASTTISVWDYMLDPTQKEKFQNQSFDASLDDPKREAADMGVLLPNSRDVGFFAKLFRRGDEDMNTLVVAEARERKRLLELEAKQRAEEEEERRRIENQGPSEVDGVTVGPAVSDAAHDPVLNGVVDVNRLAYKPRVPKAGGNRAQAGASRPPQAASMTPSSSSSQRSDEGSRGTNQGAADAAARMKNMFIGWGTKLQDAYASATGPVSSDEEQERESTERQRSQLSSSVLAPETDAWGNAWSPEVRPPSRFVSNVAPQDQRKQPSIDGNPWASPSAVTFPTKEKSALANTLFDEEDARFKIQGSSSPSKAVEKLPPVPDSAGKPPPPPPSKDEAESYDPLGVGGL